ncbi:HAD hydrolase-like protein [Marinilabilia sp.]|uniref:HAD hydrolase-like protein n=1 Tax=Marinilabilia sp. TaxID=2021252 RepID=UPI0025C03545|nr:HAD hydrolase-like protein [Marinilabilia sp.]
MDKIIPITTLFLDIGGVLLSNGWGHESRKAAAEYFNLNYNEMQVRHKLTMVTYEEGKLTINEYLNRIVFYQKRPFTLNQFQEFMFAQTTPNMEMIEFIRQLKEKYQLKIAVVNNEARELNEYRIKKFKLNQFVDFFISSCFVHFRKPDADMFNIALDIAQVAAKQVVYIEDVQMFVEVAGDLGIRGIRHKNFLSTSAQLATMGLEV